MKPGMKMYMLANQRSDLRDDYRSEFEKRNGPGGEHDKMYQEVRPGNRYTENRYAENRGAENNEARYSYSAYNQMPESRSRDRRGREHYDNGRYAPKNRYETENNFKMEGGREEMQGPTNYGRYEMMSPYSYGEEGPTNEDRPMNRIGFALENEYEHNPYEIRHNYRAGADSPRMHEMDRMKPNAAKPGHASGAAEGGRFGKEQAEKWTKKMKNQDGTTGAHWRFPEVLSAMSQHQIDCDPYEFYAVVNAMYSDYSKVLSKYGINDDVAAYAELAKAFIDDEDAVDNKVSMYYHCIVKH